ncbi:hypothetical protein TNCV_1494291 [Trichonephila clavipes]|nr:hypothetical protein TNCV_1494291 [Trichonephila clavipes]
MVLGLVPTIHMSSDVLRLLGAQAPNAKVGPTCDPLKQRSQSGGPTCVLLHNPQRSRQLATLAIPTLLEYCRTHNLLQVPIAELAERWTELPQVSGSNPGPGRFIQRLELCSQSSVVSSSQR